MKILSIRKFPEYRDRAIQYLQESWPEVPGIIYKDCITHCLKTNQPLPQWYLLKKSNEIIGCAGLITNDFISRMDLYPWLCALYISENHRGKGYSSLLIEQLKLDTMALGFANLNLSTDHVGYYEKYGFKYIGDGHHPWGESSRIYQYICAETIPQTKTNPVVYFEIPVKDVARASMFYTHVFGFTFDLEVIDGYEMAIFPMDSNQSGIGGALAKGDVYEPTKAGTIVYFKTQSIDATLTRVIQANGKVLYPKITNEKYGFSVAEFEDSEGNRIALHEN